MEGQERGRGVKQMMSSKEQRTQSDEGRVAECQAVETVLTDSHSVAERRRLVSHRRAAGAAEHAGH